MRLTRHVMPRNQQHVLLRSFVCTGGFNDPDMLQIGNGGLRLCEERSHFALWAALKSPLLVGADLRYAAVHHIQPFTHISMHTSSHTANKTTTPKLCPNSAQVTSPCLAGGAALT